MRINPKSFTLALALTTVLAASSAVAATRPAKTQSREIDNPREPNIIVRLIDTIKRHLPHISGDDIIVNPPAPSTPAIP